MAQFFASLFAAILTLFSRPTPIPTTPTIPTPTLSQTTLIPPSPPSKPTTTCAINTLITDNPLRLKFTASLSSTTGQHISSLQWNYPNSGAWVAGSQPFSEYTFPAAGTYMIGLKVTTST